ncbi:MAG: 30S ribosomal protein S16 [Ignavibacteriae bacterium]|nr:30S ribosomal protein S16 [Ignavibacteriota bacterium]
MVKIRLRRIGKKKLPIYKLVVTDERNPRTGAYIEALGNYDPNINTDLRSLKEERVYYWLAKGAQPSDTVRSLFRRTGLWLRWTLKKQGKDEATTAKVLERWQMQQAERGKRDADRKARRLKKKKAAVKEAPAETATPAAEQAAAPAGQ